MLAVLYSARKRTMLCSSLNLPHSWCVFLNYYNQLLKKESYKNLCLARWECRLHLKVIKSFITGFSCSGRLPTRVPSTYCKSMESYATKLYYYLPTENGNRCGLWNSDPAPKILNSFNRICLETLIEAIYSCFSWFFSMIWNFEN